MLFCPVHPQARRKALKQLEFKSDIMPKVLVAVPMKIVVWDAPPWSLVDVC
jgi:hypothetical protein